MGKIKVTECGGIKGLKVVEPTVFGDARGYFMETYNYNVKVQKHMENGLESYFLLKTRNSSSFRKDLHMVFLYFPSMRNLFTNALISIIQMMRVA